MKPGDIVAVLTTSIQFETKEPIVYNNVLGHGPDGLIEAMSQLGALLPGLMSSMENSKDIKITFNYHANVPVIDSSKKGEKN